MRSLFAAVTILAGSTSIAHADAYCDHVQGVADAESAILMGPEVFGSLGYLEAADTATTVATSNDARLIAGVRIKLGGIYQGFVTRDHAKAQCRRHAAIDAVVGASQHKALEARAKILEDALPDAQKFLAQATADLEARRANAQDVTATRIRVEELRQLAEDTRRQLEALPPATGSLKGALADYYEADADMERDEGKLRSAQAWDLSVRLGVNEFLDRDTPQPVFAAVSASFNVGWFFEGGANGRAQSARAQLVHEAHADDAIGATVVQLKNVLAVEEKREEETRALAGDLERQLKELRDLGGDQTRRYRETVWFEWVKANADHEYLATHVESLKEVLGQ
ncbi:MAG TPA: hypothetical protein VL463_35800 [Kofleriaceae bacterium]|nr:hypothetical protein [Kofleriaceae bacterium]